MPEPTYEELQATNEQLAKLLVSMSDRLQESAREISAKAWAEGASAMFATCKVIMTRQDGLSSVEGIEYGDPRHSWPVNPYASPLDHLGEEIPNGPSEPA